MSDYDSIHLNNALICLNVPYLSICLNTMAEYYWMIAPEYPWKACRPARNHCKRFLEVAKLAYATKTKESITSQKLGCRDFWQIANSVLNKGKPAIPPLFNGPKVLSSASDKAKLFAENFSRNFNLYDSGISLPVFPSRTNLELYNIPRTPKMVKKVIMNHDSSKMSNCQRSWLYSITGSIELWAWTFIHTSWTLQYMSERVLFSRLLEGLIGGPCI